MREKLLSTSDFSSIKGSYAVFESQKNITLLRVMEIAHQFLLLEEISVPFEVAKKKIPSFREWIEKKGPEHTSWLVYKIDLSSCKVQTCYSFSRECFVSISEESTFFPRLMNLELFEVSNAQRKKIGPLLSSDGIDSRKVWNPPKIFDGKKIKSAQFSMMKGVWPKDSSELSSRVIHLYFDKENPLFIFPYWIEVGDEYNIVKIQTIDSGYCHYFPFKQIPKIAPSIQKIEYKPNAGLSIEIESDEEDLEVAAIGKKQNTFLSTFLPYEKIKEGNKIKIFISSSLLDQNLEKNLTYSLTVIPKNEPHLIEDREHFFHFSP